MPSIWDLPQQEPKRGPAMDEARRRAVAMLGLLGAGLPSSSDLDTSALYRSGRMDAMAGGPTRGEYMDKQRDAISNVAFGLLGAIEPLWHGSPHKFSKFDLSKIGTGEGAQAYGHGAYLAESQGVGKSYKDMAKDSFFIERPNEAAARLYDELEKISVVPGKVAVGSTRRLVDKDEFVKGVVSGMSDFNWWNFPAKARDAVEASYAGNLYESRLRWPDAAREAADPLGPGHFLDWDKPLSEQAPEVSAAIDKALYRIGTTFKRGDFKDVQDVMRFIGSGSDSLGSAAAKDVGIPGIRYLDAGSRGTGQGTHNYVVFDDALIEILKRNGEPVNALTPDVNLEELSNELKRFAENNNFLVSRSARKPASPESSLFDVGPASMEGYEPYFGMEYRKIPGASNRENFVNPKLARIIEDATDENFIFRRAELLPESGLSLDIPTTPREGVLYRGMSADEYDDILRTGQIQSKGEYNIGDVQVGTTSFSTDPRSAASYASGFAPAMFKPTPNRPAYVVAIKDPGTHKRIGALLNTDERSIEGAIPASSILEVFEGLPYQFSRGNYEVRKGYDGLKSGSSSSYSPSVGWRKIGIPDLVARQVASGDPQTSLQLMRDPQIAEILNGLLGP